MNRITYTHLLVVVTNLTLLILMESERRWLIKEEAILGRVVGARA